MKTDTEKRWSHRRTEQSHSTHLGRPGELLEAGGGKEGPSHKDTRKQGFVYTLILGLKTPNRTPITSIVLKHSFVCFSHYSNLSKVKVL